MHMLSTGFHHRKCWPALNLDTLSLFHPNFHTSLRFLFPLSPAAKEPYSWDSLNELNRPTCRP
jgi:hypothetical protein